MGRLVWGRSSSPCRYSRQLHPRRVRDACKHYKHVALQQLVSTYIQPCVHTALITLLPLTVYKVMVEVVHDAARHHASLNF